MKTLLCLGTVALLWAQQINLNNLQLRLNRPMRKIPLTYNGAALRTQSLGWLLPNQDYTIVPGTVSDPNYANDTIIGNGAGRNLSSSTPAFCEGAFFDSLGTNLAYLFLGNERIKFATASQSMGLAFFYDGNLAERYDISPDRGGTNRTVSIKGIATLMFNFPSTSGDPCAPNLPTPSPDSLGDGSYTFFYRLLPAQAHQWDSPFYSPPRNGTIAGNTPIRTASKKTEDIRLANALNNQSGPQCPSIGPTTQLSELFDFVYFSTPVDVTDSASYYVMVGSERYNVNTYILTDTIYLFLGPASSDPNTYPCYNREGGRPGRSLFSIAIYDTVNGTFFGTPSQFGLPIPDWL
ncbi:MAG: hypothetical protein ABDH66_08025, partial [Bacteroidia bacterium]